MAETDSLIMKGCVCAVCKKPATRFSNKGSSGVGVCDDHTYDDFEKHLEATRSEWDSDDVDETMDAHLTHPELFEEFD